MNYLDEKCYFAGEIIYNRHYSVRQKRDIIEFLEKQGFKTDFEKQVGEDDKTVRHLVYVNEEPMYRRRALLRASICPYQLFVTDAMKLAQ